MLISVFFTSLWASQPQPPGGLERRKSGPPTVANSSFPSTPFSPPDTVEAKLRQENASLIASKNTLDGRVQQLQLGLDEKEKERLRHIDEIKKFIVEKTKLEEQMKRLQSDLLTAQQVAARSNAGGMGRRTSSTSTASPPSSPTQDMVPKTQFDVAQALAQRMEEMLHTVEGERDKLRVKAEELANQLAVPAVEQQKKEWQEKIGDLRRLMTALEKIKPPPVPTLDLSVISRRESTVKKPDDVFNASFNASFSRGRRNTLVRGQSPPNRLGSRVAGTSPLLEANPGITRNGSPQEQPLIDFLQNYEAFNEGSDRPQQWVDLEQWRQAYLELKRYLEKIKASESSDDDSPESAAASTSVLTSDLEKTELVKELRAQITVLTSDLEKTELVKKLRAQITEKSQVEVTLYAAQKENLRLTAERNALLKITGLNGNDLTHVDNEVTIGKRLPLAVALNNLCALLRSEHKRVVRQGPDGTWSVQKISGGCCSN